MSWVETWAEAAEASHDKDKRTRQLTRELLTWLHGRSWPVFLTQTYRRSFDPVEVLRRWYRSLAVLLSPLGVTAASWAVERHQDQRRCHVHSLLSLNCAAMSRIRARSSQKSPTPSKTSLSKYSPTPNAWEAWYRPVKEAAFRRDGICRIYPTDSESSAALWYVMKYVLKSLSTEYPTLAYPVSTSEPSETFIPKTTTEIANRSTTTQPKPISPDDTLWGIWERKDGFHVAVDVTDVYTQGVMGAKERSTWRSVRADSAIGSSTAIAGG